MVTRESIKDLATRFLREVKDAVEIGLGERAYHNPRILSRKSSEISTGDRSSTLTMEFIEPEIREFNAHKVDIWCQRNLLGRPLVENDSANIERLKHALLEAGVARLETQSYLRALIRQWCASKEPYRFPEDSEGLLEEFAIAVADGKVVTESIDCIASMMLPDGPIELDEEVTLRAITQDELIRFGRESFRKSWELAEDLPYPHGLQKKLIPDTRWLVLAVNVAHHRDGHTEKSKLRNIVDAFLIGAAFCKEGGFAYLPYSPITHYGSIGAGGGKPLSQVIGSPMTKPYELDRETAHKLQAAWPKLLQIARDDSHYLGTAARRLVDGLGRIRPDDAVIDFSIGLEALLSPGEQELSYRIPMRAAYVMAWEGGEIGKTFKDLRALYKVRSKIVHGDKVSQPRLQDSFRNGQRVLRHISWWFLNRLDIPKRTILERIDDRIEKRLF